MLLISRECLVERSLPDRLLEGLALYNSIPGGRGPYKGMQCRACRMQQSPRTPASSSHTVPKGRTQSQSWVDRFRYLEGRGFWGSEEPSYSSQTGWDCSPEIPRRPGTRAHLSAWVGSIREEWGESLRMMAPFIWELGGDLGPRLGEGDASLGPRAAERECVGLPGLHEGMGE